MKKELRGNDWITFLAKYYLTQAYQNAEKARTCKMGEIARNTFRIQAKEWLEKAHNEVSK